MKLWIARDCDEALWCYDKKPFINGLCFACDEDGELMFQIASKLFPEVTFENSPRQIEINYVMNGL